MCLAVETDRLHLRGTGSLPLFHGKRACQKGAGVATTKLFGALLARFGRLFFDPLDRNAPLDLILQL